MKRKIKLTVMLLLVIILTVSVIQNKAVKVSYISVSSENIPEAFDGFTIAHISDLHNETFGENNKEIVSMIENEDPDIIVITGDIMDSRRTDRGVAENFIREALDIAPVYFVSGNHESRIIYEYALFRENITSLGAVVLEDECVVLKRGEEKINLLGVIDPAFKGASASDKYKEADILKNTIEDIKGEGYNILLSHRPEYFDVYVSSDIDLIFSGHAHGGQFVLPFIGGLFAPGQGFFPEYTSGAHNTDNTTLIISRGLGNSLFPLRINNPPEIIIAELTGAN